MKVYIERNNIQVELIRFRKKIATLLTLETLKWEYTFATDVLIAIRYESPLVQGAPGAPATFRDMTTSVHAILGHFQFGT